MEWASIGETAELMTTLITGHVEEPRAPGKRHQRWAIMSMVPAKILGPIMVGDNARVGSNSVVVKDVPAGATVVGIPGRVIEPRKQDTKSQLREAMAKKIGFDAYGQSPEMPDPVAQAIDLMLDHMHVVDNKMKILSSALEKAGIKVNLEMPQLDVNNLEEPQPNSYPQRDRPKENS
jgi:serine O-acetyltransferase